MTIHPVRRPVRHPWAVTLLALASLLPVTAVGRRAAAAPVDFSRDIQPLLARRCLSCHGPDTQEGGLRLDEAAAATGELASGARAIVPGDVAASLILERIVSEDPDVRMPPEGARLTPAQVGALRDWIGAGAEWKEHWAFRAPGRPPGRWDGPILLTILVKNVCSLLELFFYICLNLRFFCLLLSME